MALDSTQKTALGNYIANSTDPSVIQWRTPATRDDASLATWLNALESPPFVVWNKMVTPEQWRSAIIQGAVQLDNLTVGKRDSLLWVCGGSLDMTNPVNRQTIDDLCGSQNILKAALVAVQKRPARRIEKVFATGTGTDANPATATLEGQISVDKVSDILNGV